MKSILIYFFVFGLQFACCLNGDTEINLENDGDEKQALVAMPQEVEENRISPDTNFVGNKKIFQATHEWKTVEPDEVIPPGLHVRMNLQTGLREAKLLEQAKGVHAAKDREEALSSTFQALIEDTLQELKNEQDGAEVPDIDNLSLPIEHDDNLLKKAELKRILKKFKGDKPPKEQSKPGLRSIDQLKKEFQELNVDVKLDSEILNELLSRYNNTDLSEQERLDILENLEYYLHQIDNANLFVDVGGLTLLARDLNGTSHSLQSSSLLVLAAAVQSNPHSKVVALKEGFLELCLRVMLSTTSPKVRALGVHAFSATIRNFPFAQKKFCDIGGIDFVVELLKSGSLGDRVVVKVISMVSDLLEEQEYTRKDEYMNEDLKREKLNQYSTVQLVERVSKTDWCRLLPQFLTIDDLSLSESVLNAMSAWFQSCHSHFLDSLSKLNDLAKGLKTLRGTEEQQEYFAELAIKVEEMSQRIKAKVEL